MKKKSIYPSFNRAFAKFRKVIAVCVLILTGLFFSHDNFAQPWTYDFGTAASSFSTANTINTTFINANSPTPSGGGTYLVRTATTGNQGTGFTLTNPGTSLGTGTELQINASVTASTNKFTVYGWNSPSNTAYLKVKLRSTSGGNGIYAINLGDGLSVTYQDATDYTNYVHSIASVQITYASGAISTVVVRTNGANTTVSSSGIAKDADQIIEIYANNNINSVTYTNSGTNTLNPGCWDLWVDGTKLSPSGGYITAGTLSPSVNLNGLAFFAQNSTANAMTVYLDDLEYSNSLPGIVYLDDYDFDSRASANWGTNSTWIKKLSGSAAFVNTNTAVVGTNTIFTRELSVGDVLMAQATPATVRGTVAFITDDTHLTLIAGSSGTASGPYGKQASPTSANGAITILGHTVTVASSVTVDQVTCNTGSALTISSGATLTIADGTGTDFTEVNTVVSVDGTLTINQNASANGGGGNGSTNGALNINNGGIVNVNGSLGTASSVCWTVTVSSGGQLTVASTGTVSLQRGNIANSLNIAGNAYLTAGGTMACTGSAVNNVASGGVLEIEPTAFVTGNSFTLASGGTLKIGSPDGITVNACGTGSTCGNIRSTTRSFAIDAHYEYKGVAAQVTGSGFPATLTGNLTITNTVGVTPTAAAATTVNTPGSVIVNGYLTPTSAQTIAGTGTLTGTGTVRITETTNATNNFTTQYPITNKTLTNLTLEFKGAAAQKFNTITALGGLKMNNSAGLTLGANANVNGALDLTSGLITTGANTITVGSASTAGSVANASSSSYVNGILARAYLATGSKTFDIGKGGNYRQLTFQYTALTGTPSFVSMEQFESGYPGTPSAGYVQLGTRYWHVTQSGASAYTYKIRLDPTGLTPANAVVILKYDNPNTVALATTTPNYTNSVDQSTLSDFALGEVTCVAAPSQPGAFTASSVNVCQGQTGVVYTVPNDPAATLGYSWSYTGGTGATIIGTTNSVTVDFSTSATSGTLEVTADNPCGQSTPRTIGITVNSASQPDPFIAASPNVCPGLTGVLYTVPNDPTVTYNWNYTGSGVTINGTGNSVTLDFSGSATSGTLEVTATSTFGCGTSAPRTLAITVLAPATISCIGNVSQGNDDPLCNAVVTYGAPTVGGTSPTVSYLFSGATSGSGSGDGSGSTFNVGTTTVILTATNTCASPSCSFDVEVTKISPTAPTSIISDDLDNEICIGNSIQFTANGSTAGSAGGVIYWYEGGCGSGAPLGIGAILTLDGQGTNPPVPTAGSHTYYARVQDNCLENTTCASITITVNSGPPTNTVSAVNAPADACNGDVVLITATTTGGPGISYSWNQGSGSSPVLFSDNIGGPFAAGPLVTALPQVYVQYGAACCGFSGYYVCAQAVNGCGSTTNKCKWSRGTVSVPQSITPPDQIVACPNDVKIYSCSTSGGATVYTWTLNGLTAPITPNGGNNPSNVSVTFPPAFVSGQLCVTAALTCQGSSTSAPKCITITKNPAIPGVIAGPAQICPGATGMGYSVTPVTGASGYAWTVPAGVTITSATNTPSITVSFPTPYPGNPSICVTALNGTCGTSPVRCKNVYSGIPATPASITGPLSNVCGSVVQYSVNQVAGLTYSWTSPVGTTLSSSTGAIVQLTVSPTFTSGILSVTASSALCAPAASAPRTVTIIGKPSMPGVITQQPPGNFCAGDFLNFSVTDPVVGPIPTYFWQINHGTITNGQGTNNVDVTWGPPGSGFVNVSANNGCGVSSTRSQTFATWVGCREEGINANTSSSASFSIYPNPAHGNLTVSIDAKENADFTLQFADVSGRVVLSDNRTGLAGLNIYEFDLSLLSKGVYMLEVKSSLNNWKTKVVVE